MASLLLTHSSAAVRREPFRPLAWVAAVLTAGVLLHIDRVPLWVSLGTLLMVTWRLASGHRPLPLPGIVIRTLLALILLAAVFVRFRTLNGLGAGTALLMLMAGIKLLETHRRRDQFIVLGGSLFLLLAAALDRQALTRAPLYLLVLWASVSALAVAAYTPELPRQKSKSRAAKKKARPDSPPSPDPQLDEPEWAAMSPAHRADGLSNKDAAWLGGRALLYALPLAVLLFIVFPRLPSAFWAVPRTDEAITGLSDSMSPGSITELTSSYDVAFRVRFDGALPPPQERYWRGPVLHVFDGVTWRHQVGVLYRQLKLEHQGEPYRYQVSLEPSRQHWWFGLDTPDAAPVNGKVFLTYDYELVASEPVNETTTYGLVSYTHNRTSGPLPLDTRRYDTSLSPDRNPRTLAFARDLRKRVGSDRAYVDALLQYFHTHGFVYSVEPPPLGYNSVDDFLFNTRTGFCGHYASAFVTAMRAAGIPARVVTGYLGGEWNPIGHYLVIRQSDAHAWAEVWLEGRGWTRVDPTAVVAPERLQRGILDLLPDAGSAPARLVHSWPWLSSLLQRWDATNAWWNDHVVKFDYESQLRLLERLGLHSPDVRLLGWLFAGVLTAWLGWIAWQLSHTGTGARRTDRLGAAYERLCRKLERAAVPRAAHQGPLDYADSLAARRPDLAASVRPLLMKYASLRYGVPATDGSYHADVLSFERAVARLRPRKVDRTSHDR